MMVAMLVRIRGKALKTEYAAKMKTKDEHMAIL
jgi:hypothetical protein